MGTARGPTPVFLYLPCRNSPQHSIHRTHKTWVGLKASSRSEAGLWQFFWAPEPW